MRSGNRCGTSWNTAPLPMPSSAIAEEQEPDRDTHRRHRAHECDADADSGKQHDQHAVSANAIRQPPADGPQKASGDNDHRREVTGRDA